MHDACQVYTTHYCHLTVSQQWQHNELPLCQLHLPPWGHHRAWVVLQTRSGGPGSRPHAPLSPLFKHKDFLYLSQSPLLLPASILVFLSLYSYLRSTIVILCPCLSLQSTLYQIPAPPCFCCNIMTITTTTPTSDRIGTKNWIEIKVYGKWWTRGSKQQLCRGFCKWLILLFHEWTCLPFLR